MIRDTATPPNYLPVMAKKTADVAPEQLELAPVSPDTQLVNPTLVSTVQLVPGAAVETLADFEANEVYRGLKLADTDVPQAQREIDTTSPLANLACRDNIVPDGPGTVGEALV